MFHRAPCFSQCLCLALLCLFCFFGLSPDARAAEAPLPVIVSIAPQKYMLERIAGYRVTVAVLVKPGADPHSYEPTPAQMRSCASARVWFTIGVPFEDVWLPRICNTADNLLVVSTIANIRRLRFADDALRLADLEASRKAGAAAPDKAAPPAANATGASWKMTPRAESAREQDEDRHHQMEGSGHEEHRHGPADGHSGGEDPHVWLSPMLVREMLPAMAKELGRLMPEHAKEFRANAEKFAAELEELDRKLEEGFSDFPREQRVFLTFHPSWRYFAHNYGLVELTIEADGKEPGPQSMKAVIDAARAYGIRTIFVEPQFSKTAAKAIAANIGAAVVEADPLAEDLSATYMDMAAKLVESFKR